jgi:hypothetical protein
MDQHTVEWVEEPSGLHQEECADSPVQSRPPKSMPFTSPYFSLDFPNYNYIRPINFKNFLSARPIPHSAATDSQSLLFESVSFVPIIWVKYNSSDL